MAKARKIRPSDREFLEAYRLLEQAYLSIEAYHIAAIFAPDYSLKEFAKKTGFSPGRLSQFGWYATNTRGKKRQPGMKKTWGRYNDPIPMSRIQFRHIEKIRDSPVYDDEVPVPMTTKAQHRIVGAAYVLPMFAGTHEQFHQPGLYLRSMTHFHVVLFEESQKLNTNKLQSEVLVALRSALGSTQIFGDAQVRDFARKLAGRTDDDLKDAISWHNDVYREAYEKFSYIFRRWGQWKYRDG